MTELQALSSLFTAHLLANSLLFVVSLYQLLFDQIDPLLLSSFAWYKEGTFDLDQNTWPDASGINHATLSGSDLAELRQ